MSGTRPKRHPQVSYTQTLLSGAFPQMQYLNIITRTGKLGSAHCKENETRQSPGKDSKGNDEGGGIASWKVGHQILAPCVLSTWHHAPFSLSAHATETCAKKWKIKQKVSPCLVWKQLEQGWCHTLIQRHAKWDVVAAGIALWTQSTLYRKKKRNTFSQEQSIFLYMKKRVWQ